MNMVSSYLKYSTAATKPGTVVHLQCGFMAYTSVVLVHVYNLGHSCVWLVAFEFHGYGTCIALVS